jgi:glucan phosphoethanolaminetransferase (alkaline phosphatase superfamily)
LTRYHFSNHIYLEISDFLFDYADIGEMFTPNQVTMYHAVNNPPILGISLTGMLNVAVAYLMYLIMIRWRWRSLLVIPGYFVVSLFLWVACIALMGFAARALT